MYLLDTNVISELRRHRPHGSVLKWFEGVPDSALFLSAVTLGELQAGVERTRASNPGRAREIEQWIDQVTQTYSLLPMDGPAFRKWAQLMLGKSEDLYEDAMIAATALLHGLTVVTRNERDFEPFGVQLLNPFATSSPQE